MRIEFIGTGNAHGTPTPGCGCAICREAQINLERRRRAPCVAISTADNSSSLIIDAGEEEGIKVAELEIEFAEMDGYTAESRAGELLMGVAFYHPGQ